MDTERAGLEGVAQELQTQETALLSWHHAQEEYVQQLKSRIHELSQDLADKRAQVEATNAQLRARMDQAHLDMEAERAAREAAASARERHWMLEVDRERTVSKELRLTLAKVEMRLEVSVTATERKVQELQAQHGLKLKALREKLLLALEAQRTGEVSQPQSKVRLRPLKPVRVVRVRRVCWGCWGCWGWPGGLVDWGCLDY